MDLIMKDYVSIPRAEILSRDQALTAKDAAISEQEKRIAELEREVKIWCDSYLSERQRREEGEALLKCVAPIVVDAYATNRTHTFCLAAEMIRQHFRKHEPIPAGREEERGG